MEKVDPIDAWIWGVIFVLSVIAASLFLDLPATLRTTGLVYDKF